MNRLTEPEEGMDIYIYLYFIGLIGRRNEITYLPKHG